MYIIRTFIYYRCYNIYISIHMEIYIVIIELPGVHTNKWSLDNRVFQTPLFKTQSWIVLRAGKLRGAFLLHTLIITQHWVVPCAGQLLRAQLFYDQKNLLTHSPGLFLALTKVARETCPIHRPKFPMTAT